MACCLGKIVCVSIIPFFYKILIKPLADFRKFVSRLFVVSFQLKLIKLNFIFAEISHFFLFLYVFLVITIRSHILKKKKSPYILYRQPKLVFRIRRVSYSSAFKKYFNLAIF